MAIVLGLIGAVSWGVADFAARFASRRVGAYRTLFFMQLFGFVALTAYLESTGGISRGVAPGWQPWALGAVAGILNTIASLSLYHSFRVGVMSVVAPISSSYPALTVLLSLLSGERVQPLRMFGLAVTVIGVVLAAISFGQPGANDPSAQKSMPNSHMSKGVGWAIISALGFGVLFWFLGFHVVPVAGSAFSVWMIRLSTFCTLALVAAPARQTLDLPRGSVWWLLAAIGITDTVAFVANNAALHIGQVSVVSVLASLYGAVTVLLCWIFLRERLERTQWLGVVLIFVGVVLVSL
jgi:drug/metabolite transporter (DMT)-like permease